MVWKYIYKKDNYERSINMIYSQEVEEMCPVAQGVQSWMLLRFLTEAKWVQS